MTYYIPESPLIDFHLKERKVKSFGIVIVTEPSFLNIYFFLFTALILPPRNLNIQHIPQITRNYSCQKSPASDGCDNAHFAVKGAVMRRDKCAISRALLMWARDEMLCGPLENPETFHFCQSFVSLVACSLAFPLRLVVHQE